MVDFETTLQLAEDLQPLMVYLRTRGIIGVDGYKKKIQLDSQAFKRLFPDVQAKENGHAEAVHNGFSIVAYLN